MAKNTVPRTRKRRLVEFIGWVGVICVVVAYMTVTLKLLEPSNLLYGMLNIFGSLGILLSSSQKRDFQPVLLNIVWIMVAITGIVINITA